MNTQAKDIEVKTIGNGHSVRPTVRVWTGVAAVVAALVAAGAVGMRKESQVRSTAPALAQVGVSTPLQRDLDTQAAFLGQYVTGEVGAGILVAVLLVVLSVSIGVRTFRRENV